MVFFSSFFIFLVTKLNISGLEFTLNYKVFLSVRASTCDGDIGDYGSNEIF